MIFVFDSQGVMDFCQNDTVALQMLDDESMKAFQSKLSDLECINSLSECRNCECIDKDQNLYEINFGNNFKIVFTQSIKINHKGFIDSALINRIKIIKVEKNI